MKFLSLEIICTENGESMIDQKHLDLLKHSVDDWNKWRRKNQTIEIDLREAHLAKANLIEADLRKAILVGANLIKANLQESFLLDANLMGAEL